MKVHRIFQAFYLFLGLLKDKCLKRKIKGVKNILLSAESGIGNLLMFTPTIKVIRRSFPKARICLVVAPRGTCEVLSGSSLVDEIIEYDQKNEETIRKLRAHHFDLGIASLPSMGWLTALLMYRCRVLVKVGHDFYSRFGLRPFRFRGSYPYKVNIEKGLHEVEQNLNLARRVGLKPLDSDKKYEFHLEQQNRNFACEYFRKNRLKDVVAVHPGCSRNKPTKRWNKFGPFINEFRKRYPEFDILVFIGPDEIELKDSLNITGVEGIHVVQDISLKDTAALLELCLVLVSSDSGLAHIACAVGIKTVTIFGQVYPELSRPFLNNTVISKNLACQPCGDEARCCYGFECLRSVSVDEVIEKAYLSAQSSK